MCCQSLALVICADALPTGKSKSIIIKEMCLIMYFDQICVAKFVFMAFPPNQSVHICPHLTIFLCLTRQNYRRFSLQPKKFVHGCSRFVHKCSLLRKKFKKEAFHTSFMFSLRAAIKQVLFMMYQFNDLLPQN